MTNRPIALSALRAPTNAAREIPSVKAMTNAITRADRSRPLRLDRANAQIDAMRMLSRIPWEEAIAMAPSAVLVLVLLKLKGPSYPATLPVLERPTRRRFAGRTVLGILRARDHEI